jgi:hypothetical protein
VATGQNKATDVLEANHELRVRSSHPRFDQMTKRGSSVVVCGIRADDGKYRIMTSTPSNVYCNVTWLLS